MAPNIKPFFVFFPSSTLQFIWNQHEQERNGRLNKSKSERAKLKPEQKNRLRNVPGSDFRFKEENPSDNLSTLLGLSIGIGKFCRNIAKALSLNICLFILFKFILLEIFFFLLSISYVSGNFNLKSNRVHYH